MGLQGPLCCRSGSPPIPAETVRKYSKTSRLTVLLRPQAQNYSVTRLWLILADPMAQGRAPRFSAASGRARPTASFPV